VLERRASVEQPTYFKQLGGRGTVVTAEMRAVRGALPSGEMGKHAGDLFAALDLFHESPGSHLQGLVLQELYLEAHSFQTNDVQVDVPPDAKQGEVFVTHLHHQAGPFTAGGYSVVTVIQ
jgi:hypothetical protein